MKLNPPTRRSLPTRVRGSRRGHDFARRAGPGPSRTQSGRDRVEDVVEDDRKARGNVAIEQEREAQRRVAVDDSGETSDVREVAALGPDPSGQERGASCGRQQTAQRGELELVGECYDG